MSVIVIRPVRGAGEYSRLVEVWRSSVDATHSFLAPEHRDMIEARLATVYLPQVKLTVAEDDGTIVGFAGTAGGNLKMLFVDADYRGRGIGTRLLERVIRTDGVKTVDVNEQNSQALGFYEHAGFAEIGRSTLDGDGLPYPLIHMALYARANN